MEARTKSKIFYGYVILATCFVIMIVFWGTYYCFGVFFNSFVKEFGWNRASISGAYSIMGLTFGLSGIPIARLSGRYGPRKVIGACGVIMGLGYILISRVNSIWQFYVLYDVLIAIGMGAYISLLPIVARWFTLRRSLMTGIVFSGMGLGAIIFPPLANWLISVYQWRLSYVILGGITAVVVLAATQFLKADPRNIGMLPFGEIEAENRAFKPKGFTLRQALGTRQFWLISILYFTFLFCLVTVTVHIVIHAVGTGVPPATAAVIMSILGIFQIVGMNAMGATADRHGNKTAFIITFVLMTLSFIWVLFIAADVITFYVFAAIIGFASGGTQVLFSPIIAEVFGLRSHGVILGTASFIASFGSALGAFSAGYIFDINHSYSLAFVICAILAAMAEVYLSLLKPIIRLKEQTQSN